MCLRKRPLRPGRPDTRTPASLVLARPGTHRRQPRSATAAHGRERFAGESDQCAPRRLHRSRLDSSSWRGFVACGDVAINWGRGAVILLFAFAVAEVLFAYETCRVAGGYFGRRNV